MKTPKPAHNQSARTLPNDSALSLPKGWREVRLGDVAELSKTSWKLFDEPYPYIGLEHINKNKLRLNGIGDSNSVASNKYRFNSGDILFGKLRPYFRKVVLAKFDGICSTDIWVIKPTGETDNVFLFYFFANTALVDISYSTSSGTRMPRADWNFLSKTLWNFPPLKEQKAIASVLGALDDKIENNQRMNETLEEMALAIFKSWFVGFDPVHAKAADDAPAHTDADTAALFPSTFNDDGLPEGWEKTTVGDLVVPKRGKTITKSKTIEGVIPVVAGGLEPAYFHNQSNVNNPVITISASGANAGFTRLYNENIWASDCSYISKEQTDTPYFWYVFLKTYQEQIYHMQQGAAQPHIYPSDLMRLELCVPLDVKVIQYFELLISPYFQRISIAQQESKTLAELRDTLLPKLMSGEIRVKDAEQEVEAIA